MMSRYDDILARLRTATGPDDEIDKAIVDLLRRPTAGGLPFCGGILGIASFTMHFDAVLGLRKDCLPSLVLVMAFTSGGEAQVREAWDFEGDYEQEGPGTVGQPAIVVLIALFEALKAKEE